jgi:glycine/D-amino acid oxidase-like deaminating enzyme
MCTLGKKELGGVMNSINRRSFLFSGALAMGSMLVKSHALAGLGQNSTSSHPILAHARRLSQSGNLGQKQIQELSTTVSAFSDSKGRVTEELQQVLYTFEVEFRNRLDSSGAQAYQGVVANLGAKIIAPMELPDEAGPLWLLGEHPFADYQSQAKLPAEADFVIVGAGLTGSSAAYHLRELHPEASILILDGGNPACQSTGRNGGNFELMPENFIGTYEGLPAERLKFLKALHPKEDPRILEFEADRQTRAIFKFCQRNSHRFTQLVTRNQLACDFTPKGWLRIAVTAIEERGLFEEVAFAKTLGIHFDIWSAEKIRSTIKIPAKFAGRLAPKSGNYHPFKFVNSTLSLLLKNKVQLYTQTQVADLRVKSGSVLVKTARGEIRAKRVILATNAFSSRLFPELSLIEPYQSQILNLEHVENTIQGMTVTENQGDLYYNFPASKQYTDAKGIARGTAHVGGGLDRPVENVDVLPRSIDVFHEVKAATDLRFKDTRGQPPSRVWTGPMGFTRDRLPVIGPLYHQRNVCPEIVVAAGFNGYGGSYCVEAGYTAAYMASRGEAPQDFEADIFAPSRV